MDPGEKGAHERLNDFIDEARHYGEARNLPSQEGTSRLSPHLAFGEISPAQCWHALEDDDSEGAQIFRSELGWRDYAQNQIVSMPDYGARPANPAFEHFPGATTSTRWRPGSMAAPVTPLSMPGCVSSGTPAGCTTVSA
jgi:deoxyribodipyrimidine photo-lyase